MKLNHENIYPCAARVVVVAGFAWLIKIASVAKKPRATRQKAKCDVNVSVDVDVEMWPPPESG